MEKKPERLQKLISRCGGASRRKAEGLILEGRVKVNGATAKLGDSAILGRDAVTLDGELLHAPREKLYIALNKPRGYVTTLHDELGRRCVPGLLGDIEGRVYPVGRLDRESEGLLLLTDDGDFANAISHPKNHIAKIYRISVRPAVTEQQLAKMEAGIVLDGRLTAPAKAKVIGGEEGRSVIELTIYEGRNREIRRMCESLGLEVARLCRVGVGNLKLGGLKPGEHRELEPHEVSSLLKAAGLHPSSEKADKPRRAGGARNG